jgi:hypothetical protein
MIGGASSRLCRLMCGKPVAFRLSGFFFNRVCDPKVRGRSPENYDDPLRKA